MELSELLQFTRDLNVLFIEDDENFRKETTDILEILFNSVNVSTNGIEGLKKYNSFYEQKHYYYDLVISDVSMPLMDGEKLVQEIKKVNEHQFIVLISACTENNKLINFIKLGIEDFLAKPISQAALKECFYNVSKKIHNYKNLIECSTPIEKNQRIIDNLLVVDDQEFDIDIYK